MEIKVKCVCGSVYSFEEVPLSGRLAFPISCTNCGADGTAQANEYIARKLAGDLDVRQKQKGLLGLFGFGRKKSDFDDDANETSSQTVDESGDEASRIRVALAMVGAIAVGAASAFGWLQLAKATGFEFGFVAWAIGGLVGGASRLFAPRGHYWLGPTAALVAFLAIGGGQVLVTKWLVDSEIDQALPLAYEETRQFAEQAVQAESDDDVRIVLAGYKLMGAGPIANEHQGSTLTANRQLFRLGWTLHGVIDREPGSTPTFKQLAEGAQPERITSEEVERFKAKELPELRAFLDGKPSQKEYEATLKELIYTKISLQNLIVQSIRPYSLLWLALGLYTAYKLARNAGLSY